jgi:chromosome segregation ATPase
MTVMDDVERRRFIDTLRSDEQFRADVRRELLTNELLEMPERMADLRRDLAALTEITAEQGRQLDAHGRQLEAHGRQLEEHGRQLAEHGRQLEAHGRQLEAHGRQLEEHGRQLALIIDVLAEQRQDINRLAQEMAEQRQDISRLAQEMADQRTDFTDLARSVVGYMQRTVDVTERFESKLDLVRAEMSSGFSTVHARIDQLAAEVRDLGDLGSP